ncbi:MULTISPECIES: DUF2922 domain-containing protein [Oceanobacillus]|uniref:DUF2922 domain-containing protein n=1 Tax=Oceanobacillus kimchii TaxID=746691 RepID=A0ABQ5TL22_9BACI|nr:MULTISPECIES: DUF2922 domain-containing protein [Oceanobacillus]MBT2600863.1 DUF2922 domain-containing protein [Oceanobacillus sp. ISL-74]MBT2650740.1 DUF2922 domain-containing protein [Oceanobacillus sp. ISL-73]MCT1575618.1 DUF2922 domain-containing protein [Oceanobacillus kimchii]MCT2137249.1 DUF2922 domain-containing protein [Oceanobacillus kimchii]OEH55430.1 hypothetical protein AQ616_04435 [Oceanobacillus sp. E9]
MRRLELKFTNQLGRVVTYSLDQPIEPVDTNAINEAMDTIISENAFTSSGGDLLEKHSARIVERTVEDIELG